MTDHLAWYIARASGIIVWGLLVASMTWGLLYATRVFGRRVSSWWLLGVHRFLGALAVVFTGIHVGALLLDQYIGFGLRDAFVPFVGPWHPVAVAWGILAMYLLVAVEVTSLLKARLSYRVWRTVHLGSYPLFALATTHALSAGTDSRAVLGDGIAIAIGAVAVGLAIVGIDRRAMSDPQRPAPARRPTQPDWQ